MLDLDKPKRNKIPLKFLRVFFLAYEDVVVVVVVGTVVGKTAFADESLLPLFTDR